MPFYIVLCVCMYVQLEEKVDSLTKKLADSERMVELMKSSNRELNATIVSQLAVGGVQWGRVHLVFTH